MHLHEDIRQAVCTGVRGLARYDFGLELFRVDVVDRGLSRRFSQKIRLFHIKFGIIVCVMKWKRIAGYEDYEISDTGLVRSLKRGGTRVLSPRKNGRNGYLFVSLCKEGKAKHIFVHRLVAEAFVPNPLGLETVNHRD